MEQPLKRAPGAERDAGLIDLKSYGAVFWRWKWLMLVIVVAVTAAAYLYASGQPAQYSATAQLAYEQRLNVGNFASGSYGDALQQALEVQSVTTVALSRDVGKIAAESLGARDAEELGYTVSALVEQPAGRNAYPSTATVTAVGGNAETAAKVANAYALGFVKWRKGRQLDQVKQAKKIINAKMGAYTTAEDRLAPGYLLLQQQLGDLQVLEGTITGDFRLVSPAVAPEAPFAPRPKRTAAIAFAASLLAVAALALIAEQATGRVRDPRDAAAMLGLPLVGRIPRLSSKQVGAGHVAALQDPDSPGAEAVRVLRANLKFFTVDEAMRSLFITSAAQGEGKSVTIANLAVSMAASGKHIILIDGDLRRPRMHSYFGLPDQVGLTSVLVGDIGVEKALQTVALATRTGGGGLKVLPAGPLPPNPGELIDSERFGRLLQALTDQCDLVLVDAPALLPVGDAVSVAAAVDAVLVLVDMSHTRAPVMRDLAEAVGRLQCRVLGVVAVRESMRRGSYRYKYYRYAGADAAQPPVKAGMPSPADDAGDPAAAQAARAAQAAAAAEPPAPAS